MKEGLIQGISFLVIGLAIWGSHFAGRLWLETKEERDRLLSRVYLTLVTITLGVITIVYLPQAAFETLSYVLLPVPPARREAVLVDHRPTHMAGLLVASYPGDSSQG